MNNEKQKTAVIMSRVSSDDQAKGYSLNIQEEALRKYCEIKGIKIVYTFREDHSAKDFNRPRFKDFLLKAKKSRGEIDYLLFTTWDRFSRNTTDSYIMIKKLLSMGIEPQAIEQPLDMSIPENKAMLAFYLAIPEIDNERRSIKIKGGVRASLKSGRYCFTPPKGYTKGRDTLNKPLMKPNEDAKHIKKMFEMIANGYSQEETRKTLKKQGFNISRSRISDLLRNELYISRIKIPVFNKEPAHIIKGLHEPIIEIDLFHKVQVILQGNQIKRNLPKYNTMKEELPLRGTLICSKCGKVLTGSPSKSKTGKKHYYYHCNHCHNERYRADKINNIIIEFLGEFSFGDDRSFIELFFT